MGLLRMYIRKTLLSEAAKGPRDLPANYQVVVDGSRGDRGVDIKIVDEDSGAVAELRAHGDYHGFGPCFNAFFVGWSVAEEGWGPMLYDIAMELATERGAGLMADRTEVSAEAYRVWDFYLKNRSDVEAVQMDDLKNLLTPEEKDNCMQKSFDEKLWDDFPSLISQTKELRGKIRKNMFVDSPLTKVYRKKNRNVLNALEKEQKIEYI